MILLKHFALPLICVSMLLMDRSVPNQSRAQIKEEDVSPLARLENQPGRTTVAALQMLQDMKAKWQDGLATINSDYVADAEKVIATLEMLCDLVNEDAQLSRSQQHQIWEMIITLATSNEIELLSSPGDCGLIVMQLAGFINTCK